jgi:hypothetical protein
LSHGIRRAASLSDATVSDHRDRQNGDQSIGVYTRAIAGEDWQWMRRIADRRHADEDAVLS